MDRCCCCDSPRRCANHSSPLVKREEVQTPRMSNQSPVECWIDRDRCHSRNIIGAATYVRAKVVHAVFLDRPRKISRERSHRQPANQPQVVFLAQGGPCESGGTAVAVSVVPIIATSAGAAPVASSTSSSFSSIIGSLLPPLSSTSSPPSTPDIVGALPRLGCS
jgi:hypothetical protein